MTEGTTSEGLEGSGRITRRDFFRRVRGRDPAVTAVGAEGIQKPPEVISRQQYDIHFEPGIHPNPLADTLLRRPTEKEIRGKFLQGDLTVHDWNPEVVKRMREYSPLVLGLEGIGSILGLGDYYWPALPGSPREMSGREIMYLVSGDKTYGSILKDPKIARMDNTREREYALKFLAEQGGTLMLPIVMAFLIKRFGEEAVTRRDLFRHLSKVVKVGALALVLGRFLPLLAYPFSPTSEIEGAAKVVTGLTKPRLIDSKWLDGRTALLIAKTQDAMELLKLPEGTAASVVMGSAHTYEADKFLNDKKAREEAIRDYANQLFDDIYPNLDLLPGFWDELLESGLVPSLNESAKRKFIMDDILLGLTIGKVYKISQPESDYTDDPIGTVRELIKQTDWFQSKQVTKAVSSLGDTNAYLDLMSAGYGPPLARSYKNNNLSDIRMV